MHAYVSIEKGRVSLLLFFFLVSYHTISYHIILCRIEYCTKKGIHTYISYSSYSFASCIFLFMFHVHESLPDPAFDPVLVCSILFHVFGFTLM